jgi:hypothetical protein
MKPIVLEIELGFHSGPKGVVAGLISTSMHAIVKIVVFKAY